MNPLGMRLYTKGLSGAALSSSKASMGATFCSKRTILTTASRPRPRKIMGSRQYSMFEDDPYSPFYKPWMFVVTAGVALYYQYDHRYNTFTTWPGELRNDLRMATNKKQSPRESERYFYQALKKARALAPEKFGDEYRLKITDIGIALGNMLEEQKDLHGAYHIYADAFDDITRGSTTPSQVPISCDFESIRAIALSFKLAELAWKLDQREDREFYLIFAISGFRRIELALSQSGSTVNKKALKDRVLKDPLHLPQWACSARLQSMSLDWMSEFGVKQIEREVRRRNRGSSDGNTHIV